jgi:DNA-binding response OmpR family regulator
MGHEPTPFELMADISLTSPSTPRILVVDDDAAFRFLLTDALQRFGYEVDVAEDGAIAWEMLRLKHYNLLITDNNMPKMTGVELLEIMHGARFVLPVIMATGKTPDDELASQSCPLPAAVLIKPFGRKLLLETVQDVLRRANPSTPPPPQRASATVSAPVFAS